MFGHLDVIAWLAVARFHEGQETPTLWVSVLDHAMDQTARILVYMSNHGVVSVRVDGELADRLDALGAATGRPRAYYVREAIIAHLEDLEDYYLAVEVAQRVHAGTMPTYTAEQARAELGASGAESTGDDPLSRIA